jgi:hypothetical protein
VRTVLLERYISRWKKLAGANVVFAPAFFVFLTLGGAAANAMKSHAKSRKLLNLWPVHAAFMSLGVSVGPIERIRAVFAVAIEPAAGPASRTKGR